MKIVKYNKGAVVVVQNSPNKGFFYVIKSGILTVDSEHRFNDKVLSRFEPGDSFGLVSALTGHRFLVTVFASTDSEVIEIPISMIGSYLTNKKKLALKMLSILTKELKALHKYLSRVNLPEDRKTDPEKLKTDADIYLSLNLPKYASYALVKYLEWIKQHDGDAQNIFDAQKKLQELGIDYHGFNWSSHSEVLQKDEVLFLENESSSDIYVIKSGAVKLFKLAKGQELIIDVLGPGEIFGEMAIIDDSYRMASAVTDTQSELFRFSKGNLFDSVGETILQKIFESLARRVWFCHQRLVILRIPNPTTRLFAFVYNLIRNSEIKNLNIKKASNSFTFNISFDELKKMCGLMRINDEKIREFVKDKNLVIEKNSIKIINRSRIEEKVAYYRTQSGQLSMF